MKVKLMHYTHLIVAIEAIRTCWDSLSKMDSYSKCNECGNKNKPEEKKCKCGEETVFILGKNDEALLDRIVNIHKHQSTIEHLVMTFKIEGISRALLQELARHRIASLSVKSTRYTLKELKKERCFRKTKQVTNSKNVSSITNIHTKEDIKTYSKYLVWTNNQRVNQASIKALYNLQEMLQNGISNDIAKYCLPEAYKTSLVYTINMRSLLNLLELRMSKSALPEFRLLAEQLYKETSKVYPELFFKKLRKEDR